MGKIRRSVQMLKASWSVLRAHKELAVFPLLSGTAGLLVAASFLVPAAVVSWDSVRANGGWEPGSYVLLGLFYLVAAYVTIFFNTALISQANVALAGGDPSVKDGLRVAASNWLRILPWALLSATVSVVLRAIEERLGFLGRIITGLIGIAWNVVTFLVLPVLVLEKTGVRTALRRSSEMLKRTWGENVAGNIGLGALSVLAVLPAALLVVLGAIAGQSVFMALFALALIWMLVVAVLTSAMSGIYQTALYQFAAEGRTAPEFGQVDFSQAFRERRR
jgi:hypothetical protein